MHNRVALILGGADSVWQDVNAALDLGEFHGAVACNDVGMSWRGQLDAWISIHDENLRKWADRRRRRGLPDHKALYTHHDVPDMTVTPYRMGPMQKDVGSSGHFALKVALFDLGFDKAVLCGVPMNAEGRHFFNPRPWHVASVYQQAWLDTLPLIKDRVRSCSGWTADLLGRPSVEWLSEPLPEAYTEQVNVGAAS